MRDSSDPAAINRLSPPSPSRPSSRRRFLLGGLGLAGALVIGWGVMPPRQRLHAAPPEGLDPALLPLNGWVMVSKDGQVSVMLARSEMGQGVMTSLPMLVAEELDIPLSRIAVMQAPIRKIYGDITMLADGLPFHPEETGWIKRGAQWMSRKLMREVGIMVTGGSTSVKDSWLPMREAGAAARARLVAAAAERWQVPAAECRTENGEVLHASGHRAGYGELAERAARIGDVPFRLKEASEFRIIGHSQPRLDAPAKSSGSAQFGLDVKLPGMRYAMVVMCPVFAGTLAGYDAASLKDMPGVLEVMPLEADRSGAAAAVAVVADTRWHAMRAQKALSVQWNEGANAALSSDSILHELATALEADEGFTYFRRGDADKAAGATRIEATYRAPFLAHAALEPVNCTARFASGRLTLWVPTQVPSIAVTAAARAAGIDEDAVDLHVTQLGGGFGRRLDTDMVVQATQIARKLNGAPVQLLWNRTQDLAHDFFRPAAVARLSAEMDTQGHLLTWRTHSASGSPIHHLTHRAFGLPMVGPDKTTVEGLYDHPYEIPHQRVSHVIVDSAVPLGTWRSVGHSQNAFFKESFIDEIAHAAQVDPVAFRRGLLAAHPRHLAVLDAAVSLAGEPAAGRAHGVALHQSFGSIVAQVAEVSVDGAAIRVHKVWCAVDCGTVVNPEGVRQQVESSVAFGLSAALNDEISLRDGRVRQSNFHDYRTLRLSDMPEVEVAILNSTEPPEGMGEPAVPPVAPAVANAVFRLTGQRLRSLPLKLEGSVS